MKSRVKVIVMPKHELDNGFKRFMVPFSFSIMGHLILMAFMIYGLPHQNSGSRPMLLPSSVIDVDIVTLSSPGPAAPVSQKQPQPADLKPQAPPEQSVVSDVVVVKPKVKPEVPKKSVAPVIQKAEVSVAPPKAKPKTSLKKKTFKSTRIIKKAIARIESQSRNERPDTVSAAISRLKQQVGDHPPAGTDTPQTGKAEAQSGTGFSGGNIKGSSQMLRLIDIYRVEIAFRVNRNWAFSKQMAGLRSDLAVKLAFQVLPDGSIRDVWFDERSGNVYLDNSAKKAVLKSNPLPPHPAGVTRKFVTIGLRFTPQGVK